MAPLARVARSPGITADASPQALAVGIELNEGQIAPLTFIHSKDDDDKSLGQYPRNVGGNRLRIQFDLA
jgi:hypothetical protein